MPELFTNVLWAIYDPAAAWRILGWYFMSETADPVMNAVLGAILVAALAMWKFTNWTQASKTVDTVLQLASCWVPIWVLVALYSVCVTPSPSHTYTHTLLSIPCSACAVS